MHQKANAIEKTIQIIKLIAQETGEIGTNEISKILRLPKSTVSRILTTLCDHGFLTKNTETRKFRLGHWFVSVGFSQFQKINNDLVFIAKPLIDELRDTLGITISFATLHGDTVILSYFAKNRAFVTFDLQLGLKIALNAAASSKAMLAYLPEKKVDLLLKKKLPRLTKKTITDPKKLKTHLKEVREKGFAVDNEEYSLGLQAVGVPVFGPDKDPIASVVAIGLTIEKEMESDSKIIAALKGTAKKISDHLYPNL